jgi:sulfur relay (sulfurtransferase) DsrF/TusC family protein
MSMPHLVVGSDSAMILMVHPYGISQEYLCHCHLMERQLLSEQKAMVTTIKVM